MFKIKVTLLTAGAMLVLAEPGLAQTMQGFGASPDMIQRYQERETYSKPAALRAHRPGRRVQSEPMAQRPVGPPWAGPNECWEDLGYGRYESCD